MLDRAPTITPDARASDGRVADAVAVVIIARVIAAMHALEAAVDIVIERFLGGDA